MTAEAVHANEIKATFNKAVASDAKITLTKGSSTVASTAVVAGDGMSATITLTGKLSDGTYTVTVVAGNDTVTADVTAKNETLTSFEIGSTLKEVSKDSAKDKATAVISYKALNQYGDKINYSADLTAVTVSIGKVTNVSPCKTSEAGQIKVEEIPSMYAIPGQSFTVVIVDTVNNTGVTLNKTAVYGASATAAEFTAAGVYSTAKSAFKDVADGDKIADYELLFTAKDQYGDDMSAKEVATLASNGAIQVTIAGGLTNIKANDSYKDNALAANQREVGDTTYFAVPFEAASSDTDKNKANAGNYTVTVVNNTKGIVFTGEYSVTAGTVIASVQLTPKDTIYANQDNEMDYVITDTDGKELTDYATLKGIEVKGNSTGDKFTWKQNSNGSAKLVYKPAAMFTAASARDYTKSEVRACTITANKAESGKLIVKSQTFSVYYQRTPLAVTGLASNATSVTTNGKLNVELKNLVVLDQYSNPYSEGDLKGAYDTIGADIYVTSKSAIAAGEAKIGTTDLSTATAPTVMSEKVEIIMNSGTDKVKLNFVVSNAAVNMTKASKDGFTATITKGDANKVSGLYVASVNGGCPLWADGVNYHAYLMKSDDSATGVKADTDKWSNCGDVVVKGKVNGKDVVIDPNQYAFVGAEQNGELMLDGVQSYALAGKVITETREFSIVVSTADGAQTITGKVEVTNAPEVAKTISANDVATDFTVTATAAKSKVFDLVSADALFTMKSQYNSIVSGSELLTYTVESLTVSGSGVEVDRVAKDDKAELDVSLLKPYLNGSNINYLTLDSKVSGSAGDAVIAKVVVEGAIKGESKTASKTITLTITF